jgi:hypothetical protein
MDEANSAELYLDPRAHKRPFPPGWLGSFRQRSALGGRDLSGTANVARRRGRSTLPNPKANPAISHAVLGSQGRVLNPGRSARSRRMVAAPLAAGAAGSISITATREGIDCASYGGC